MVPLHEDEETILSTGTVVQRGLPSKTPLVPSEHLSFFTPRVGQASLGLDGSDTSFNPPGGVFTRRMWAGGEMIFDKDNHLCVGDEAWEKTIVESANLKKLKNGGEMIVVWVKKIIGNERGTCLTDRRSWIFQPKLVETTTPKSSATSSAAFVVEKETSIEPSPSLITSPTKIQQCASSLFRYSALTFNAHAIHLSSSWAQQVEGHADIVVHGPLNLCLLLRKWGREKANWRVNTDGQFVIGEGGRKIHTVQYRAMKPIHANRPYWIGLSSSSDDLGDSVGDRVLAVKSGGQVAMQATITSW
ncbi:hypothetical protein CBS101457_002018 [Exobasidium rhododendri]|nr:hypothetical protein CBS101457_002018 [Exobasidium rhododendri]